MAHTYIEFKYQNGTTKRLAIWPMLDPSAAVAVLLEEEPPVEVRLSVTDGNNTVTASVSTNEEEHPGITVNGAAPGNRELNLGSFGLPCPTYPNRIAARLCAGDPAYETDTPIALVAHNINDVKLAEARAKPENSPQAHEEAGIC